jgi:predicted MFS family arabinose efflux permease
MFNNISAPIKQYMIITGNYWCFTLTDGALRMLVLLHFHQLGYSPLSLAMLFLFYEVFGVLTNLIGGWLAARIGLNKTMNIGLFLQVFALLMLTLPNEYLSISYVMLAQAFSGIAKDLNKLSAKSSIKVITLSSEKSEQALQSRLFKWVALLTGSKNTLKGVGFFLGGWLLMLCGFQGAMMLMAGTLFLVAIISAILLKEDLGKAPFKAKFKEIFSHNASLNNLSGARLCLFAARDVWFVVALPIYLSSQLGWQFDNIGLFFACWIILYGFVQAYTPALFKMNTLQTHSTTGKLASHWSLSLAVIMLLLSILLTTLPLYANTVIIAGLLCFAIVFAINSSLHSYLIVSLAKSDRVSMDVGFYYTANALGRLFGTVLSGYIYQLYGLVLCIAVSCILLVLSTLLIRRV